MIRCRRPAAPQVASRRGDGVSFEIPAHIGGQVVRAPGPRQWCDTVHGGTRRTVGTAGTADASTDIAVATIAGRGRSVLEPLVGMFVNTLVLRAEVDPSASFTTLLDQIRSVDLAGFTHADVPFESVVRGGRSGVRSEAFSPRWRR